MEPVSGGGVCACASTSAVETDKMDNAKSEAWPSRAN